MDVSYEEFAGPFLNIVQITEVMDTELPPVNNSLLELTNQSCEVLKNDISTPRREKNSSTSTNSDLNVAGVNNFEGVPECIGSNNKFIKRTIIKKQVNPASATRKRVRNENGTVDKQAKKLRAEGKGGIGRKSIPIDEKKMKPACSDKCRFKCYKKISEVDRTKAFDAYYGLSDKTKQWDCLNNWIIVKNASNSSDEEAGIARKISDVVSYDYRIPSSSGFTSVCKTMFLNTLDISYQCVRTAKEKLKKIGLTGIIEQDQRGVHANRPFKYTESMKNVIRDHIRSFPVIDSHYCREGTQKKYLEEGLSISRMYRLYRKEDSTTLISESMYRHIFNTEFNLGFYIPKKDRCEQCEIFKHLSSEEKENGKIAHNQHLQNKAEVRRLMKEDKAKSLSDATVCTANFDLQKILTTPRSEISNMYYMSKLCVWNFTIFQSGCNIGKCHLWNETVGKRGSNEIASFVWKFIEAKSKSANQINFYTDNCGGQNRNKNMFSMYVKAANHFNVQIIHRFLEVGHTQSEGDSMHARIENHCRRKEIFTQDQWADCMKECKKEIPYEVEQIPQEHIYDFDELSESFNWKIVKISKLREIVVTPKIISVQIKYDFFENAKKVTVLKKNVTITEICKLNLKRAYNARIPLAPRKNDDLCTMLTKKLIPNEFVDDFRKVLND